MKTKISRETIKLLRMEADRAYSFLPPEAREQLTLKDVYTIMKKTWKDGNKISPEKREGILSNGT